MCLRVGAHRGPVVPFGLRCLPGDCARYLSGLFWRCLVLMSRLPAA